MVRQNDGDARMRNIVVVRIHPNENKPKRNGKKWKQSPKAKQPIDSDIFKSLCCERHANIYR